MAVPTVGRAGLVVLGLLLATIAVRFLGRLTTGFVRSIEAAADTAAFFL